MDVATSKDLVFGSGLGALRTAVALTRARPVRKTKEGKLWSLVENKQKTVPLPLFEKDQTGPRAIHSVCRMSLCTPVSQVQGGP